jgi:hypothetical protein
MTSWVVGVGAHGSAIARERANLDGRRVLAADSVHDPRIDGLAEWADSIFLVADELTHSDAVSVIERMAAADRSRSTSEYDVGCPVGFLHARTPAAMDALSARQVSQAGQTGPGRPDVLVDSTLDSPAPSAAPGLVTLPYRGIAAADIRAAGPMRIFAITAHGMSDHVYLDSDYICGRVREPALVPGGLGFLPSCTEKPYDCMFRPHGHALPAYEIEAQHIFMNSCGSSQFEQGDFGPDFSIWYAALEGPARSYVGTLRWKAGHGVEALLYRHLLNAGFPLGLAVAILNRVLPGYRIEGGPVYCLLGDPLDRVSSGQSPGQAQEIKAPAASITFRGGYARCVLRDTDLVSAWRAGRLLIHAREPAPIYFSGVPALHEPAIHVVAVSQADCDGDVAVRVDDYRPIAARITDIQATFSRYLNPGLGIAGMYPNTVRQGGGENIQNRILHINRLFHRSVTDPLSVPRLLRSYQRMEEDVSALDRATAMDIARRIRKSVYSISDHYRETFEVLRVTSGRACPHCRAPAAQRVLRSLIDSSAGRKELVCPLCGIIEDVPDERLSVRLASPSPVVAGEEFTASLAITNHDATATHGYCVAGITRADEYGAQGPDSASPVRVPPAGTGSVEFPLRFGQGTRRHLYTIKCALVVTGRIYVTRQPVGIAAPGRA